MTVYTTRTSNSPIPLEFEIRLATFRHLDHLFRLHGERRVA